VASYNPFRRGSQGWGVSIHGNHADRRENGSSWGCLCDVCFARKKSSEREFVVLTGTHLGVKLLTAYLSHLFYTLHICLVSLNLCVLCQHLIAQYAAELFSAPIVVFHHFHETSHLNDVSRGSLTNYRNLMIFTS
jgi:hypothetical protein